MFTPTEKEFLQLTKKGNLIPVYTEIPDDLDTPVSAYYRLARNCKYSFLLESVEGEEKVAQFSFLSCDPELIIQTKNNDAAITAIKNNKAIRQTKTFKDSPLSLIRDTLKKYTFVNLPGLPRFCGGMVGFMSYDIVRFFEKLPHKSTDDLKLPDIVMILAKNLVIFDHRNHKIKILNCVSVNPDSSNQTKAQQYRKAIKEIQETSAKLQKPFSITKNRQKPSKQVQLKLKSNLTQGQFVQAVNQAKEHIKAGDIIQVVLSQRFEIPLTTDPFNIYRTLRVLNPSPYMYYLDFDGIQIIGASPEALIRCENGIVETRPIAGTRPRGQTDAEDATLIQDLLADPKEKAEHIMLVDLGRNDIGRVCKQGTVQVTEFMGIEKYSHVMHMVSQVRGVLDAQYDDFDVIKAAFPAGTVSGAPKIRAMEIIEDLENVSRGPYAGCIGYFSFSGNSDTCITIRTIVATNKKAYIQTGAGIVLDSDPKKEYTETVNKAKAQIKAIELAKYL